MHRPWAKGCNHPLYVNFAYFKGHELFMYKGRVVKGGDSWGVKFNLNRVIQRPILMIQSKYIYFIEWNGSDWFYNTEIEAHVYIRHHLFCTHMWDTTIGEDSCNGRRMQTTKRGWGGTSSTTTGETILFNLSNSQLLVGTISYT